MSALPIKTYTARIVPYKRRDTKTTTPKVLLEQITTIDGDLFRDHCYVNINTTVEKTLNCMRPNKCFIVEIKAVTVQYLRRGIEPAESLSIRSIKVLGKA